MANNRSSNRQGFLERWARLAHRRRGRVILVWAVLLAALITISQVFGGEFQSEFRNPGSESQKAQDLLKARFPERSGDDAALVFQAPAGVDSAETRPRVEQLLKDVAAVAGVVGVESPYDSPGSISKDGTIGRAVVHWSTRGFDVQKASLDEFLASADAADKDGLHVEAGGAVVQMNEQPAFGSEGIGLGFAILILFIAFGSVIATGLPIGAAVFGLGAGFALIGLLTNAWKMPDFSPQFAAMIGIGVGIDYSLIVVTRFREGLHHGRTVEDSLVLALTTSGRSVMFAGLVVAISFMGLFVVGLPFVAALGTAGAIVVVTSVAVALTLMPSLLSLAGTRVDRWRVPFLHSTEGVDTNSGWYRLSRRIQGRPLPYFAVAAVVLLFMATPILSLNLGFTDAGNGGTNLRSRRAYDLLAQGFGKGFNGPLFIVADLSGDGGKTPAEKEDELARIAAKLGAAPNVVEVGKPVLNPAGDTALIPLIPGSSPQSSETIDLVHYLRKTTIPAALQGSSTHVYVTGATAGNIDAGDKISERMPFLFCGVIGLSFLLLMTVFRSVLVALKAAIMNLLSIGAAYGVVIAIFQWGWFSSVIGVEKGPVETFLPMMMFAILFGLSMDYEVFLISRVREEYLKTRDNATAVSHGLTATARVITAAAAIMVSVFGAFVLGPDRIIKEFGIGLASAILVDATIVRLILVPATMELLGDANWWMPKWLDRLLPHVNVDGPPEAAVPLPGGSPAGGK